MISCGDLINVVLEDTCAVPTLDPWSEHKLIFQDWKHRTLAIRLMFFFVLFCDFFFFIATFCLNMIVDSGQRDRKHGERVGEMRCNKSHQPNFRIMDVEFNSASHHYCNKTVLSAGSHGIRSFICCAVLFTT